MKNKKLTETNPLPGVLDDEIFDLLREKNFITEEALRNYYIRMEYDKWREAGIDIMQCIFILQREHSLLTVDEIRKIVLSPRSE